MEPVRLDSHQMAALLPADAPYGGWSDSRSKKAPSKKPHDLLFGAGATTNPKFFFANLPLPPKDDDDDSLTSRPQELKGHDLLFSTIPGLSTEPSEETLAEDDGYTLTDISEDEDEVDEGDEVDDEWVLISSEEQRDDALKFCKHGRLRETSLPQLVKPRLLLLGLFNDSMVAPLTSSKPILKRSLTTGIITIEKGQVAHHQLGIIFAKKHNSFTDMLKKFPHYHNDLVRETIVDMKTPQLSLLQIVLGKQKLIVGISEFSVMTKNHLVSTTGTLVGAGEDDCDIHFGTNALCNLSLSLNKYSMLNLLFKHLILKLSLNLTKIYKQSRAKFHKLDSLMLMEVTSLELAVLPTSMMMPKANDMVSPKLLSPTLCLSAILAVPAPLVVAQQPSPEFCPLSMPMLPNTTRKHMLSTELLELLKESIMIDYRLGKVPLPTRVVETTGLPVDDQEHNGLDDYHLKGW